MPVGDVLFLGAYTVQSKIPPRVVTLHLLLSLIHSVIGVVTNQVTVGQIKEPRLHMATW